MHETVSLFRCPQRYAWALSLAVLVLLFVGCGATGPQATLQLPMTATTARLQVSAVHVLRTSAFPANHIPPLDQTVTDARQAQQLYDALYTLPPFPSGAMNCPADFGVAYQLTFYRH